ncbi:MULTISPECIES: phosphodiesterase [unclassified Pseudomonas]|uniref:phosphodiesterase n=1 Tax=unclassified Pseudomonas TaxID=196821 RepID=UPI0017819FB8|nr:phosphodiesterase [Pseudomonas sp. PDM12]MBD9654597.1 phosphodiesterase [Pseudomonas sp. PDM12]
MTPSRLLLSLICLLPLAAQADTLKIPIGQQGADLTEVPQKGQSKRSVLEHFGLADEEHPTVGKPPITRWDYREFSVYFEYDHVIDSVRHQQPRTTATE